MTCSYLASTAIIGACATFAGLPSPHCRLAGDAEGMTNVSPAGVVPRAGGGYEHLGEVMELFADVVGERRHLQVAGRVDVIVVPSVEGIGELRERSRKV